jgi:hypothetical protein
MAPLRDANPAEHVRRDGRAELADRPLPSASSAFNAVGPCRFDWHERLLAVFSRMDNAIRRCGEKRPDRQPMDKGTVPVQGSVIAVYSAQNLVTCYG